ncbi:hypothetical protein Q8A73_006388 [Channa argus]|nr:hypothetical protein Q8A73_006388 [Channa argus]
MDSSVKLASYSLYSVDRRRESGKRKINLEEQTFRKRMNNTMSKYHDFSPLQYLQVLSPPFFTCHKEKKGLFPALE